MNFQAKKLILRVSSFLQHFPATEEWFDIKFIPHELTMGLWSLKLDDGNHGTVNET